MFNPINLGLSGLEPTLGGGGVFHPPAVTPLSLKLFDPNFGQGKGVQKSIRQTMSPIVSIMTSPLKCAFRWASFLKFFIFYPMKLKLVQGAIKVC